MPGARRSDCGRDGSTQRFLAALAVGLLSVSILPAQVTPDQAAAMLLNSARQAYNEKNYSFAITRFREFLSRFGGHRDAPSARYGLALSLLDLPDKDYAGAAEELQRLAGTKDFPEHAHVLYYLGLAQRGLGTKELWQAAAKPQEASSRRDAAKKRFEEAAKQFSAAADAFTARVKQPKADAKELPIDLEWAARARCDLAEMQMRTLRAKEAQATVVPFLKDPLWTKSRYRNLGLYYHGFASFLLQDYLTAGRSLNMLQPFADPVFGTHARYLLARVHHLADERAEAGEHYDGVLADYAQQKKDAAETLKRPETLKNDPGEKARLEALVKGPPPEHVARASFWRGVMLYEDGRFADAQSHFATFLQQYPGSMLLPEVQLRLGFCQVQLKQFADALKTLQPLADKEPRLTDQALFWMGKAQAGAADANNAAAYQQALKTAMDTFRRAADKAQQLGGSDPEAKSRRGEILLELADTHQFAQQYKEAAITYSQILNDKLLPQREEELLERQAAALQLAGDYGASEQICTRFQQAYPKSPLLAAVLFRYADNAYFRARALEQNPNAPNRTQELARLQEEMIKRYQIVVDKYPESAFINLARYGLGTALYREGDLEKAKDILEKIPPAERTGEHLAAVPYVLADCLIRLAPSKAEDALAAGRVQEGLQSAIEALDGFVASQPGAAQTPDALIKLGFCHQRLAALLAEPHERAKALGNARAAYEKLMQQFPKHALQPQAVFERAKCLAQAGDTGGAINELRRFNNDLKTAPIAPMALLQLATLLRGQNKAAEAVTVLAQCRQQHEGNLLKDPARLDWVPILQYQHGLALREAGKFAEARGIFDQAAKSFANRPEGAEAALRWAQCLKEEGLQKLAAARQALAAPDPKPEAIAASNRSREEGLNMIRGAVQHLEGQIKQLKDKQPGWEVRARLLYEAAWGCRAIAETEVAAAREKIHEEQGKKLQEEAKKKTPAGQPLPAMPLPQVPLSAVPLQPAEKNARLHYEALMHDFADTPLAADARFEVAELLSERGEHEEAVKLLNEALDKEPPPDLSDKLHIRLGLCLAAKGDTEAALGQFDAVAKNPKSPLVGQAQYRAGECLMQKKEWKKAAERLAVFRDQQPFQNLPDLTDRALLRLGHALAQAGQWDQSRQAHELMIARFSKSPWVHEARYGIGWSHQNKKEYDNAVNVYTQVTANTLTEVAAKAALGIGQCRLEQKRYADAVNALLVVPFTYDYPEFTAAALCEAGRAFVELKQPEQAERLWQRVIKNHPNSEWAGVARARLAALSKRESE